jgi:hypothetical protein
MNASAALALRVILLSGVLQSAAVLAADDSLHALIDQRLQPAAGLTPALCSDAEFLRRVSLDLTGMPPTADEARAFLADTAADKREKLVDRLLASPHYARHLAATLDLMLMERRANTHVSADDWQAWLLKSVRENKPWNILAREILQADGDDPALRPAARFVLDRGSDPNLLTMDVGRVFFGRDLQCAQCHDHPLVADYLQSDYQGLLAYVAPGYAMTRKEGEAQITLHAERAGSDLTFESVFDQGTQYRTGPRMPDEVAIEEPTFLPGDEYEVAPADNVKPVPKFSRRKNLAELATSGSNRAFNENIANRLWAHMFGRGLVHPLDLHHPENLATDPELLRMLGERFAAMNFDIRGFVREIALSQSYQRSFDAPADPAAAAQLASANLTQWEEQRPALEQAATASSDAYATVLDQWHQMQTAILPVAAELDAARTAYADARKKSDEAAQALAATTAQHQAKQTVAATVQQAAVSAQQAAQALPEDTELAGAAQVLATRSQAIAAEAAALATTVEQQTAALQPLTAALQAVQSTVEAPLAKVAPLKAAEKQAEQAMLAARRQAAIDKQALLALERRIEMAHRVAQLPGITQAIAAATAAVTARQAEQVAAQQQIAEYAAVLAQHEATVKTATDAMTAASAGLEVAKAEHAKRTELASAIQTAREAAGAAQQKATDDATLTQVAALLETRVGVAQAQVGEAQQQVDAAAANEKAAGEALAAAIKGLDEATAERTRREQVITAAAAAVAAAQAELAAKEAERTTALEALTEDLGEEFTVASLKPLTPEQLCWSVFRVTGVYDRYWQAEVAELDKTAPLTDEQKQDPAQLAARAVDLEQRTFDKLKGNVGTFVAFYGAGAGQPQGDFFSTADQALFAANGGSINSWVAPAGDNVTQRVITQTDPRVAAEELYLGVLTRPPSEDEIAEVTSYLSSRTDDRALAAQELVWGLLNCAEFRFNH